jgi:hypothetical protein
MNRIHATSVGMYSIQVRRCIEIALSCVETDRNKRPSIGLIATGLNKTESRSHVLDALRSQPSLPTSQVWSQMIWYIFFRPNSIMVYKSYETVPTKLCLHFYSLYVMLVPSETCKKNTIFIKKYYHSIMRLQSRAHNCSHVRHIEGACFV